MKKNNGETNNIRIGFVKWFNYEKGYGVIVDMDDAKEFFCHIKDLERSVAIKLDENELVLFVPGFDEKRKRNTTHSVKLIEDINDIRKVLCFWAEKINCVSSKNTYIENGIASFLQKKKSSNEYGINEEDFKEFIKILVELSSVVDYYVSLVQIIRNAINNRYKPDRANKIIELIEIKLIGELPERIVSELNEDGFTSIYSSLLVCILYPYDTEKNLENLFSKNEVPTIFNNLSQLISDINGEPNASKIKGNKRLLTDPNFYNDIIGAELLFAINRVLYQKLDSQKMIQLYKKGYVTEIPLQYIDQHVGDLLFYDFQLLFEDFQIGKKDKLVILKKKISAVFKTEDFETIWRYWDYGEIIAGDRTNWFAEMSNILCNIDKVRYDEFKINGCKLGKWINYDEDFVCSNIDKFTTTDLKNLVEKYVLSDNQTEKLFLSNVKYVLSNGPKDYILDGKQNPWRYDYYEEIKKSYSLVSKKDWIPLNSEYLYQAGEKYVELVIKLYKDGLFHHLNDDFIIYYLDKFSIDDILSILTNEEVEVSQRKIVLKKTIFNVLYSSSKEKTNSLKQIIEVSHSLFGEEWQGWADDVEKDCSEEDLFYLWKERIIENCPYKYIKACLLNSDKDGYEEFYGYYCNGMISKDKAKELLWLNLKSDIPIDNREEFYKRLYSIKYLLKIDDSEVEQIKEMKIDIWFYRI